MYKNKSYLYQYPIYYRKLKVKQNVVLIESTHGNNISGHMYYILKELENKYSNLQLFVAAKDPNQMQQFLTKKGITRVTVIKHLSKDYCKLLASAEYLLNDTTFYPFFIKKENQRYINIWHGTPLKTLGKDVEVITDVANVQRNFYMADKIITNNMYTQDILASSHNLNGVYQGKMVTGPSPRNSVLLNKNLRSDIRKKLDFGSKKVIFYMPTWRGSVGKVVSTNDEILADLRYISNNLASDSLFFVKLHPFQKDIDLTEFDNIYSMPSEYELYEFLSSVDILVTDYSSIMYDFLLADKKIVLYTYDKEDYFKTRGVYDDIDKYPFIQSDTVESLTSELNRTSETNVNYSEMKKKFSPFDHEDGVSIICQYIFSNVNHNSINETQLYNGKETVAILSGGFWDNGITTALLNTFDNIDVTKRNYMVFFGRNKLKKEHYFRVQNLPENVVFYPIPGTVNGSFFDRVIHSLYMKKEEFNTGWIKSRIAKMYKADFKRIFGDLKIDHFIHYTGFERKYAEMIQHTPESTNRVMFVHTDMFQEYEAKQNFSKKVIFSAYKNSNKIAIVNDNLKAELAKNIPSIENRIVTVNNFLGEERILKISNENIFSTLIPTNIDYAYNGDIQDDFPHINLPYLMAHKREFFESSEIYSSYNKINITKDIEELKVIGKNASALNIENKMNVADQLLITNTLFTTKSRLLDDLFNEEIKVFINIGRYDYQKGHERLISAFEKVYKQNSNTRLIIVAPHGSLKKETIQWVKDSEAKSAIFLLGRMSNPYTLLKLCDAFVLSSHYEGLGLVVYEALALDTSVITVNLAETIQYLQNEEAIIVENSEEGIYNGMIEYLEKGGKSNKFDFSVPKNKSLLEFESLMIQ
ncbi:CDP-glycerol glycerophosphotransferase family protein [Cytobacillus horneckiae]|uniref:CDP-glycerol glycerophosphotransferase family protein n=1 Tax=Cytobacillus horneckiae TaxID=549687 RepID=UPI003D19F8DA